MRLAALLIAVAAAEEFRANLDPMIEATRWWTDGGAPPAHWVVRGESDLDDLKKTGLPIGTGSGRRDRPTRSTNPSWDAFVEAAPLDAARAIFRCFRSFAEIGGFFLSDFKPDQFTFFEGALYLVDGPAFAAGPARDFAVGTASVNAVVLPRHRACHRNSKLNGSDVAASLVASVPNCAVSPSHHSCLGRDGAPPGCESGSLAAPEAAGRCELLDASKNRGRCAAVTYKTHVHDVAAKRWLLPFVIDRSAGDDRARLEALAAAMTRPDPHARPSFTRLLAALG